MSQLIDHARYELEKIEEKPEIIDAYLVVIQAFDAMEHSGGSAAIAIPVIHELLQMKPLSALTDAKEDWIEVAENIWQNRRNGDAFSIDGGKSFYLLSERKNGKAPTYFAAKEKGKKS